MGEEVGLQTFTERKVDIGKLLRIGDKCVHNFGGDISGEVPWKTGKTKYERRRMDSHTDGCVLYVVKW